jgi:hypothetical protein
MKRLTISLLLLAACAVGLTAQAKLRVAVVEFNVKGNVKIKDAGAIVAEWLAAALAKTAKYEVLERVLLDKILAEQEIQLSGLIDESTAVRIGDLYGAQAIASGTVMEWNGSYSLSARIVDTESGAVLGSATFVTKNPGDLPGKMDMVAKVLEGSMPQSALDRAGAGDSGGPKTGFPVSIVKASVRNGRNRVILDKGTSDGVIKGVIFVILLPKWGESEVTGERTVLGYRRIGALTVSYLEPTYSGGDFVADFTEPYTLAEIEREGVAIYTYPGIEMAFHSYNAGGAYTIGMPLGTDFRMDVSFGYELAVPFLFLPHPRMILEYSFGVPLLGNYSAGSFVDTGISIGMGTAFDDIDIGFFAGPYVRFLVKGLFVKVGADVYLAFPSWDSPSFGFSVEPEVQVGYSFAFDGASWLTQ